MTPKEKAVELWDKFDEIIALNSWADEKTNIEELVLLPKKCALIAVDEIIQSGPLEPNDTEDWLQPEDWFSEANISAEKYWQEVKKEIEAL
jgi:hypothetical protein